MSLYKMSLLPFFMRKICNIKLDKLQQFLGRNVEIGRLLNRLRWASQNNQPREQKIMRFIGSLTGNTVCENGKRTLCHKSIQDTSCFPNIRQGPFSTVLCNFMKYINPRQFFITAVQFVLAKCSYDIRIQRHYHIIQVWSFFLNRKAHN